jgi:3-methyladenine DNA glycosylase AlkD
LELSILLTELESLGTEQNRKTYRAHGVLGDQYGLSFANLDKLSKRLKQNHPLALQLWATGNHDARLLAMRIADTSLLDIQTIESWGSQLDNYIVTDALSSLIAKSPHAMLIMQRWTQSDEEWLGAAGWNILSHLALQDATLPNKFFIPFLKTIRSHIHQRKNRVRYSMNNALIAIGARNLNLQSLALDVATHIGLVQVDHGATNCKTPDAASYIHKTWQHKQKKAARTGL